MAKYINGHSRQAARQASKPKDKHRPPCMMKSRPHTPPLCAQLTAVPRFYRQSRGYVHLKKNLGIT